MREEKISLTEQEVRALQGYFGHNHANINIISDLNLKKIKDMESKGWYLDLSQSQIARSNRRFYNNLWSDL